MDTSQDKKYKSYYKKKSVEKCLATVHETSDTFHAL